MYLLPGIPLSVDSEVSPPKISNFERRAISTQVWLYRSKKQSLIFNRAASSDSSTGFFKLGLIVVPSEVVAIFVFLVAE